MDLDQVDAIAKRYQGGPLGFKFYTTEDGANALELMRKFHPDGLATFMHLSNCDVGKPTPIRVDDSVWKNPIFRFRVAPYIERITSIGTSILRVVQCGTDDERALFADTVIRESIRKNPIPRFGKCEFALEVSQSLECGLHGVVITATDTRNAPDKVAFKLILDGWSMCCFDGGFDECISNIETYKDIQKALVYLLGRQTKAYTLKTA